MKKGITSHTIVRNEDRFVWFALNSVIRYVDKMLIFDTGSTDKTLEIIESLADPKIVFEKKGEVDAREMVGLRQEQLKRTKTEWFLILDGDEIWWEESIKKLKETLDRANEDVWGIITPTVNCVGDIFHYQEKEAGRYKFSGRKGHYAVRAIRRTIPGLHIDGVYPLEGYRNVDGRLITDFDEHLLYLDTPYLHLTNLPRSSNQATTVISRERKYELGIPFAPGFAYPEVLYKDPPPIVPSPWIRMSGSETLRSALETPAKKIKRRLFK